MTVTKISFEERYVGLSTDTKPTNLNVGSTFTELNTGQRFVWDGSNWVEDLTLIYALSQALK